jgi:hypothetical protein
MLPALFRFRSGVDDGWGCTYRLAIKVPSSGWPLPAINLISLAILARGRGEAESDGRKCNGSALIKIPVKNRQRGSARRICSAACPAHIAPYSNRTAPVTRAVRNRSEVTCKTKFATDRLAFCLSPAKQLYFFLRELHCGLNNCLGGQSMISIIVPRRI